PEAPATPTPDVSATPAPNTETPMVPAPAPTPEPPAEAPPAEAPAASTDAPAVSSPAPILQAPLVISRPVNPDIPAVAPNPVPPPTVFDPSKPVFGAHLSFYDILGLGGTFYSNGPNGPVIVLEPGAGAGGSAWVGAVPGTQVPTNPSLQGSTTY